MYVKKLKSPCRDCTAETGRTIEPVNCHTYCKEYLDYYNQNEINKQIKKDMKHEDSDYYAVRHAGFKNKQV